MLLRHTLLYLLSRGLTGLLNFAAVAIFTRFLTPDDYGRYALVVAAVGFCDVVLFQWLRLALLRFLPAHRDEPASLLSTLASLFLAVSVMVGALATLAILCWPEPTWRALAAIAAIILCLQGWFELNLDLLRIKLQPLRYGFLWFLKSLLALVVGAGAAALGLGAMGPLVGLLFGLLVGGAAVLQEWRGIHPKLHRALLRPILVYGLPLSITFLLSFVVETSDRFMIAYFLDERSVGVYAAGYDIIRQSLTLAMVTVNLAAYPLAIQALEQRGSEAARLQLATNGTLVLGIALPSALGLWMLRPNLGHILSAEFRTAATIIFPWITLGAFLAGFRAYYFDLAFQLGRWTTGQVWVTMVAAVMNVFLNLLLIPKVGLVGAAWATAIAYGVALLLSIVLGRRAFAIPFPLSSWGKVIVASTLMGVVLKVTPLKPGIPGLVVGVILGGSSYCLAAFLLNVGGIRTHVRNFIRGSRWRSV